MEKMEEDQQDRETWDAAAHVTRTFILYRRKSFLRRLDVWPLLVLLVFSSGMTGHELAMIAQQQTAFQQRQATAAATRCVRTADVALLVFHAPHVTTFGRADAATAIAKQKWRGSIASDYLTGQRTKETLYQEREVFEKASTKIESHPEGMRKDSREDVFYKNADEEEEERESRIGIDEGMKRKKSNAEEEKDLFPVLSWLFSSLWFVYTLVLLFCGGLLHLSTHWWVTMETLVSCWRVSSVQNATHVLVVSSCSRDVEPETLCGIERSPAQIYFFFRKKKYIYDKKLGRFLSLKYPKNLPVCDYFEWEGLQTTAPAIAPLMSKTKDATATRGPHARKLAASREEKSQSRGATAPVTTFQVAAVSKSGAGSSVTWQEGLGGNAKCDQNDKVDMLDVHDHYISPGWKGREGERLVSVIEAKYGKNEYDIPVPSFKDLFKEHAVAPFFVFQVFSISLWLLDEYWHYSVLMLVMLLFLECQMVTKRLKDFQQLRGMRMPPFPVSVYRNGAWTRLLSDQLLPGDIFAIRGRTAAGESAVVCPVDALLLQGMVVANEASLTGESVPQTKVALDRDVEGGGKERKEAREDKNCVRLDMKRRHKQHVVFAGTSILLHRNESGTFRKAKIPEKACVAFVLRTAFSTTQGKLVRTILFSHGRVTVSSREAWLFLGILLLLALAASSYVVHASLAEGLQRPFTSSRRRISSRFKLFLACSHIVMAVVPAEFPITLSLAVTMSLIFLIMKKIFCTEPFRVPYAGQVDICAFDKTGTLTSDSMRLHGVYGIGRGASTSSSDEKEKEKACGAIGEAQRRPALTAVVAAHILPGAEVDLHRGAEAVEEAQSNEDPETTQGRKTISAESAEGNLAEERIHALPHILKEHVKQTLDQQLFHWDIHFHCCCICPGAAAYDPVLVRLLQSLPFDTTAVMGCCHTLATVEGQLLGDPMEKVAFTSVGWQLLNPDTAITTQLQRMFVIARHTGPGVPWYGAAAGAARTSAWQEQQQMEAAAQPGERRERTALNGKNADTSSKSRILVAGKGSPEVMRTFLKKVPANYDVLCRHFCLKGYRVLSLACKEYMCGEGMAGEQDVLQQLTDRRRIEEDLWFAGFLVLTCPIKNYTKDDLSCIRAAGHRIVMITGDNPLTACQVARELGFFPLSPVNKHMYGSHMMSAEQQSITDNRVSIKRQQQSHDHGSARQEGEPELALCHAQEKQKTSGYADPHSCLTSRRVLILRAKQHLCTGIKGSIPARYLCPSTSDITPTITEAASFCSARGTDVQISESEYIKNQGSTRETRIGKKFVASNCFSSTFRQGAEANELNPAAGVPSAGVTKCTGRTWTTDTNGHASAASEAASSPLSIGSVRSLLYWESPEGRVVAEASSVDTISTKPRGHRGASWLCAPRVCASCGGIPATCCCSAATSSSALFPSSATADTCAGSSASAAAARSCTFSCCSATSGQSHLFFRSGKLAPLIKVPHWLAPVLSVEALAQLAATYELCITGPALDCLFVAAGATNPQQQVQLLKILVPHVAVYARMSPQQKELVIVSMNACGHTTLMCGDGTNDVGALKAAHVGVSLLCQETADKEDSYHYRYEKSVGTFKTAHCTIKSGGAEVNRGCRKSGGVPRGILGGSVCGRQCPSLARWHSSAATPSEGPCPSSSQRQFSAKAPRWRTYLEDALQQAEAADEPPLVRLGDASVASPFTFKGDSISGVKTVLRAGRATLVTVVMMYKLMALNSVVTAFSLSVLTLDGVKLGDLQTTLENLLCTVLTLLISKTQPTSENMSTSRPIASVFHPLVLLSLIGQSAIHCFTLHASWVLTRETRGLDWDPDIDGPFKPNLVNTVVFLLIASMHASTFLSNYEGAPFMKPLRENRPFCLTLGFLLCSLGILAFEIVPDFNTWLSLVPFPSKACKVRVIQLIAVDILGAWAIGWTSRKLCWWCARNRSKLPKFFH